MPRHTFAHSSRRWRLALLSILTLLTACGGGGSDSTPTLALSAKLTTDGTIVSCSSSASTSVQLVRESQNARAVSTLSCPSTVTLAGDYVPSRWTASLGSDAAVQSSTTTQLPDPQVVDLNSERFVATRKLPLNVERFPTLMLEGLTSSQSVIVSAPGAEVVRSPDSKGSAVSPDLWRWRLVLGANTYVSDAVPAAGVLQFEHSLHAEGSYFSCSSSLTGQLSYSELPSGDSPAIDTPCPHETMRRGDFVLRQIQLKWDGLPLASEATRLPAPVVIRDGERWIALKDPAIGSALQPELRLEVLDLLGSRLALSAVDERGVLNSPLGELSGQEARFRWHVANGDAVYFSPARQALSTERSTLDVLGAMAVGDIDNDGRSELLGTLSSDDGFLILGYEGNELSPLISADREFRDVRIVDLNNDGLNDLVANVYGRGCALIGLRQPEGGYEFNQPLRRDGSCIGGHGETIVVADFDADGLTDIVLPSYERFDFLWNRGQGKFEEIADRLGIAFPNYSPKVEGAVAADLNLDGFPDLVIASEVLINDGHGGFLRQVLPFAPEGVLDEGISVADLDADGIYDIVKNAPDLGPRIFWGRSDRVSFSDSGWMFGVTPLLNGSHGLTVGHWTGHHFADLIISSGLPTGPGPIVCTQATARRFECLRQALPSKAGSYQDLLLLTDLDGTGQQTLLARHGRTDLYPGAAPARHVFRIDLRSAQGLRNQHGHSLRTVCALDGSPLGLKFVDGGGGFLSQGDYIVSFSSNWCSRVYVETPTPSGLKRYGPFQTGTHEVRVSTS